MKRKNKEWSNSEKQKYIGRRATQKENAHIDQLIMFEILLGFYNSR
jgi:hypothetical protein